MKTYALSRAKPNFRTPKPRREAINIPRRNSWRTAAEYIRLFDLANNLKPTKAISNGDSKPTDHKSTRRKA